MERNFDNKNNSEGKEWKASGKAGTQAIDNRCQETEELEAGGFQPSLHIWITNELSENIGSKATLQPN